MVHIVKNKEDFEEQVKVANGKLVVIDFFATWCGPCKMIAPKLEAFATKYSDAIVVLKVDVDECEDLAVEYNISSMPTFVFLKNKEKVHEFSGANESKIEEAINKYK